MAVSTSDIIGGFGAALSGTAPQYVAGIQKREELAGVKKQEQMAAREKAMYQDAGVALQLVEAGDIQGIIDLGMDRMKMLGEFGDSNPEDTMRIITLAQRAKGGDRNSLAQLHAELMSASRIGTARGYIAAPERVKGVEVNGELRNPYTGALLGAAAGEDQGTTAYQTLTARAKSGGLVEGTPEFQQFMLNNGAGTQDTSARDDLRSEKTAALTNVRSETDRLNKSSGEIVTAYNKVMSLEPDMRNKVSGRGAINAAIMNVARLISPGVVTDEDASAFSGASKPLTEVFDFLNGQGVDMEAIRTIVDPTNPETFDVDALLSVARNVTASAFPSIQAQFDDQKRVAEIYGASDQFMKSYFGQGKLQEQVQKIMSGIQPAQSNAPMPVVNVASEAEALSLPVGTRVRFPDGQEYEVEP
jgi:hypothetical protein